MERISQSSAPKLFKRHGKARIQGMVGSAPNLIEQAYMTMYYCVGYRFRLERVTVGKSVSVMTTWLPISSCTILPLLIYLEEIVVLTIMKDIKYLYICMWKYQ